MQNNIEKTTFYAATLLALCGASVTHADEVILDDLIVDGSACVGFDCVNGESFGFDTLRLKENNLRIRAVDTSSTASFASNDWQITFNDTSNGGANKFSIDDIDGGRTPFTLEAGAPSHSLYVDDGGRLGLGTNTPVVDVHVKSGNTPTLRLEQDGSSGFTPQTWDVAGNEANFFIRDATNGSTLPFRIFPGAPSNALNIEASTGDIGLGTTAPDAALEVQRSDGTAQFLVTETGATNSSLMFRLTSNARPIFEFENGNVASDEGRWRISSANNGDFEMNNTGISGPIPVEFDLDKNGNLTLAGTVTAPSSRLFKDDINEVDGQAVLTGLEAMPIVTWHYKNQSPENVHMGPVAEDFYEAFGLGTDEQYIALNDLSGVALAAIKALNEKLRERDAQIGAMADQIADLANTVADLQTAGDIGRDK